MPALDRTFQVIELLANRGGLGVRPIARELALPIGSTHRILIDLDALAVVERTDDGDWQLSYRLLQIVGVQLERIQLPQLARPFLERLASDTRETVFLAVPSRDEIVYLDKVQTDLQLQLNVELGTRRPMYCTGLGKAILAFLPEAEQQRLLAQERFSAYTPNTITDPMLLSLELARTRARGYAIDREEIILGVHCIAVPLFNYVGRAVGAISIAGAGPRVDSERFAPLVDRITTIGKQLSFRLGYREPDREVAVLSDGAHELHSLRSANAD